MSSEEDGQDSNRVIRLQLQRFKVLPSKNSSSSFSASRSSTSKLQISSMLVKQGLKFKPLNTSNACKHDNQTTTSNHLALQALPCNGSIPASGKLPGPSTKFER
jgi:hypothetical protein